MGQGIQTFVITANNLLACGVLADLIVNNTVTSHIYSHICRRFVGRFPIDFFEDSLKYGEDLHIPVIVNRGDVVSFQMEGVDHIYIVEISGGGFISQIDGCFSGMFQIGKVSNLA